MLQPPGQGRNGTRVPFPLHRPSRTPNSPPSGTQQFPNGDKRALADAETRAYPVLAPRAPFHRNIIPDLDTQENPVLVTAPPKNASPLADAPTRKIPMLPPRLSFPYGAQGFSRPGAPRRELSPRARKTRLFLVGALLLPSLLILFELISVVILFAQIHGGIGHLQAAEAIFRSGSHSGMEAYFDPNKLQQAQGEIDAAHSDFASLNDKLEHDGSINLASSLWPTQIQTARSLGHIAVDGTMVLQRLLQTAQDLAPSIAPALQKSATPGAGEPLTPYITPASYQQINTAFDSITPLVHDMALHAQGVSLDSLPLSSSQHQLIASLLPLLPVADAALSQKAHWKDALGWFLGIGGQRAFLIEPMDRAELRATGGFTGQFGELLLNGAHMGPLHLANIGKYEEDHSAEGSAPDPIVYPKVAGQSAPAPYSSWWPVGNFGLRDANLSADLPTSARIAMDRYAYEFGSNVDGAILFTPALMKQILSATGPIVIPAYKRTITASNLENLLHYYQLDNGGITQEQIVEHVSDTQVARKLFTQRVTAALLTVVTHLPLNKMVLLGNQMLHSMKTKDLQVYVTNPQLESLIGTYGSTASLDRSTTHDGLFVVQSNLSASKASQYVANTFQDTVTLDDQGGATHNLQITLDYQQRGNVYGFDTYRDYLRVYVPPTSRLLSGNGFDQRARSYCGDAQAGYQLCQPDVYGDGSLVCSPPVEIGYATSYINDPYAGRDHPLDVTGPPSNQQSDEEGRAMFGGWVVIPKNCTMKVSLSWYVPPMSHGAYSLLLQAQASVYAQLHLVIHPAARTCSFQQGKELQFSGTMDGQDTVFRVEQQGQRCALIAQP